MKKLLFGAALFIAAAFPSCSKHDGVETPEPQPLAIAFAEGNSLEFDVDETKTVHYTITGGSGNTVVKTEMQTPDDAYTVETTPASATEGTITITAKTPTDNRVIVTVSDGSQTIMAPIVVTVILKASFDGKTIEVETPGTLSQLLADYDETTIAELTVIGNLNDEDIVTLNNLPNLAVLDMEQVNLEVLPANAFLYKNLTSVKLPLTLKTIGKGAFAGCSSLTSITIPDGITAIGRETFFGCSSLTSIMIPDGVTSIGANAFYGCSLTSITIPDGVTSIEDGAFAGCSDLINVTIGNGVTLIGDSTFHGCSSLTSITIPDGVTWIGDSAFSGCSSLTSITIPDGVTSIGANAFYGCSSLSAFYGKFASSDNRCLIVDNKLIVFTPVGLTSYTIPDGVTSIGANAFYGCSSLTSITIPDGVTSIGFQAFRGCSSLTSITIPDGVTWIGGSAFSGCSSLTSVYCKAIAPPSVEQEAFIDISETATLYVPTGSKAAYAAAAGWKNFKTIEETQF